MAPLSNSKVATARSSAPFFMRGWSPQVLAVMRTTLPTK